MLTVNVPGSIPATQLVAGGSGTQLIVNNDAQFTLWIGGDNSIDSASVNNDPRVVPLTAGSSVVVDGKNDVYAIADESASNPIQVLVIEGGLSFFQPFTELVVQGTTARVLIYSGVAALGTLIGSWAAVAGTDIFGNAYPAGLNVITKAIINNATIINAVLANAIITGSQLNQSSVFESTITFDSAGGGLFVYQSTKTTVTLGAGTTQWTSPAGVTSADVKVWGPGASGNGGVFNNYGGSGNGGGGFCETPNYTIIPSTVYTVFVNAGGASVFTGTTGNPGVACTFDFTNISGPGVRASGGDVTAGKPGGGPGGFAVTGTIGFNGGQGGFAGGKSGGGGGGAGGPGGQGLQGAQNGGTGSQAGGSSFGGGHGGAGGTQGLAGSNGVTPGGGGGGAGFTTGTLTQSGAGGDGQCVIVYATSSNILTAAISPNAGTDSAGNAFAAGFTGQLTAFQPGSNPAAAETWHTVTLDSGWTAVGDGVKYRLNGDGTVQVFGAATHAAFTGGTAMNSSNPLPSVYWPTRTRNIAGPGIPNRAGVEVTAAGILTAEANGVSCTEADVGGFYPLY